MKADFRTPADVTVFSGLSDFFFFSLPPQRKFYKDKNTLLDNLQKIINFLV